jgi:hypothetical protein
MEYRKLQYTRTAEIKLYLWKLLSNLSLCKKYHEKDSWDYILTNC